jgi:hypothetical protein
VQAHLKETQEREASDGADAAAQASPVEDVREKPAE